MIQLTLRALSVYGKKVTNSLRASEVSLNQQCSCPPGESCSVEITELPGRRFEAVVVRPRQAADNRDWAPMKTVAGMYRRLFDKRASAQRIREAVAAIVGAPLNHDGLERSAAETPTEDLKIVLVDSGTLRRARQLIVGCQVCSPYAEIPFESILDRVTGHDPGVTQYVLVDGSAKCPRCMRQLAETTLVEFDPPFDSDF